MEKEICIICAKEINTQAVYFEIVGPNGNKIAVHGHDGVEKHGGIKMCKGKRYEDK